jgi:hypothetical protein
MHVGKVRLLAKDDLLIVVSMVLLEHTFIRITALTIHHNIPPGNNDNHLRREVNSPLPLRGYRIRGTRLQQVQSRLRTNGLSASFSGSG